MNILICGDPLFCIELMHGFWESGHTGQIIKPETADQLKRAIVDMRPDLFMTLGSPLYYSDEVLNMIGQKPSSETIYIHWDTDGVLWDLAELHLVRLSKPDIVFTICMIMQECFIRRGIPCHILPFAANAPIHYVIQTDEYEGQITFVGNAYPELAKRDPHHLRYKSMEILFKPLLENDYDVHFYGSSMGGYNLNELFGAVIPYGRLHGYVPYHKIHRIYSSCFINLIPQNYEYAITKRTFEIICSGGFGLSYDIPAMRQIFPEGSGIVYTSSQKETLEQVRFYQQDTVAYKNVCIQALATAQNHTYRQRVQTIMECIHRENS